MQIIRIISSQAIIKYRQGHIIKEINKFRKRKICKRFIIIKQNTLSVMWIIESLNIGERYVIIKFFSKDKIILNGNKLSLKT